jgi:hypothetical protein
MRTYIHVCKSGVSLLCCVVVAYLLMAAGSSTGIYGSEALSNSEEVCTAKDKPKKPKKPKPGPTPLPTPE